MAYVKIAPLGPRIGLGTYETFCDFKRYRSLNQAILNNDCVIVDFVEEQPGGDYYVEVYHTKKPDQRNMYRLDKAHIKHLRKINPVDDKVIQQMSLEVIKSQRQPWEKKKESDPQTQKKYKN